MKCDLDCANCTPGCAFKNHRPEISETDFKKIVETQRTASVPIQSRRSQFDALRIQRKLRLSANRGAGIPPALPLDRSELRKFVPDQSNPALMIQETKSGLLGRQEQIDRALGPPHQVQVNEQNDAYVNFEWGKRFYEQGRDDEARQDQHEQTVAGAEFDEFGDHAGVPLDRATAPTPCPRVCRT